MNNIDYLITVAPAKAWIYQAVSEKSVLKVDVFEAGNNGQM